MAHYIPKITYGALDTPIVFANPPVGMPEVEQDDAIEHTLVSLSGQRQITVDFIEVTRRLKFGALSESEITSLRTFFRSWAILGNQFKFYENQNGSDYEIYELAELKFKPKRTGYVSANTFTYELPITIRRVEDEDQVDYSEASILNNQAVAVALTGITLDATAYTSVKIFYEVRRKTGTQEVVENGHLTAIYKDSTAAWEITAEGTQDGDDTGVSFSMSSSQIMYTSTDLTGSGYTGTMKIKNVTF